MHKSRLTSLLAVNSNKVFLGVFSSMILCTFLVGTALSQEIAVTTRSYNNARTGANLGEGVLTPKNVHRLKLTKILGIDWDDDPHLEAQPLYMPNLDMPDHKAHNVLYICTMANSVYAFDVNTGKTLWKIKRSLGMPITPRWTFSKDKPRGTEIDMWGTNDRWGILSTPVIDRETGIMYVVAWTSPDGTVDQAAYFLHAIDIKSGTELRAPLRISGSAMGPKGLVEFIDNRQKQRSALLLISMRQRTASKAAAKLLYVAFGQTQEYQIGGERPPEEKETHGWLVLFDVERFVEVGAWPTTRTGEGGGIWQGGQGPAADDEGDVYVMTSNGPWDGRNDFAETFAKLRYEVAKHPESSTSPAEHLPGNLTLVDWFTPFLDAERQADPGLHVVTTMEDAGRAANDQDLGSGGPILPVDSRFVVGAGKDGILYVLPRRNLGRMLVSRVKPVLPEGATASFFTYRPKDYGLDSDPITPPDQFTTPDPIAKRHTHHLHGSPVSWISGQKGPMLYVWGESSNLMAWGLDEKSGNIRLLARSEEVASKSSARWDAMFGGMLSLSSNGSTAGIIWAVVPLKGCWKGAITEGDANKELVEGIVYAYAADDFDAISSSDVRILRRLWQNRPTTIQEEILPHKCEAVGRVANTRFTYSKFVPPVIADGKLFVTTGDGRVLVYSLR